MAYATFFKQCCFFVPVVDTESIPIIALVGFLIILLSKETEETPVKSVG